MSTENKNNNNRFFIISRLETYFDENDSDNAIPKLEYFAGFSWDYSEKDQIEEYGTEEWTENLNEAERFETMIEAKEWFKVLREDGLKSYVTYEITLCRKAEKEDIEKIKGDADMENVEIIPLKTFYTTQED